MSNPRIAVIGDSTIDNTVWVEEGMTVLDHLGRMLPQAKIADFSNDGFTTQDVLKGARRDKVFSPGRYPKYTSEIFKPLEAGAEAIQKADYVILSVGGNNIREFLNEVVRARDKGVVITQRMPALQKALQDEYIEIFERITTLNPKAKVILMTQYYPSFIQNDYDIYAFMGLYSQVALRRGASASDGIHHLMQSIYGEIFNRLHIKPNVIVADVTSTLNPHDESNHVSQIEPSSKGGSVIAGLLASIVNNSDACLGQAVAVSGAGNVREFSKQPISNWVPVHPVAFLNVNDQDDVLVTDNHSLPVTVDECRNLILDIERAKKDYQARDARYQAAIKINAEATKLLDHLSQKNSNAVLSDLKDSLRAALNVLESRNDMDRINTLKSTAKNTAPGKPRGWMIFVGALLLLAAAATAAASALFIPVTGGLSACGFAGTLFLGATGGSMLTCGIIGSGVSRGMRQLANAAEDSIPKSRN